MSDEKKSFTYFAGWLVTRTLGLLIIISIIAMAVSLIVPLFSK